MALSETHFGEFSGNTACMKFALFVCKYQKVLSGTALIDFRGCGLLGEREFERTKRTPAATTWYVMCSVYCAYSRDLRLEMKPKGQVATF